MLSNISAHALKLLPLVGALACSLVGGPAGAETVRIGGTGAALRTMRVLAEAFQKTQPDAKVVIVPGLGSSGGRKALLGGMVEIAVTSKAGKAEEKLKGGDCNAVWKNPVRFCHF